MKIWKWFKVSIHQLRVQCAARFLVEMSVSDILMCLSCLIRSLPSVIRTGRAWLSGSHLAVHICPPFVERLSSYPNLFPYLNTCSVHSRTQQWVPSVATPLTRKSETHWTLLYRTMFAVDLPAKFTATRQAYGMFTRPSRGEIRCQMTLT